MPAYDPKSRYAKAATYRVIDHRNREVTVTETPPAPEPAVLGWHVRRQGQRPDHLAAHYLDDDAGFWRLAEANDAMQAEWLSEQAEIAIPGEGQRMTLRAAIAVDGTVDPSLTATWIEVYEQVGRPTDYRLRFPVEIGSSDFDQLVDSRLDAGSVLSVMVPDAAGSQCLVTGPVGAQRIHFENGGAGSYVEVSGSDSSVAMDREAKSTIWTDVTDADVVTSIVAGYGLVPDVEATSAGHYEAKHVLVQRESDLSFIHRLARRNGFVFWVTCDTVGVETAHFKRPPVDGKPTATLRINDTTPPLDSFDLRWDVERPTSVEAMQLDVGSLQDIDGASTDAGLSSLGARDLAAITGDVRSIVLAAPVDDAGDLRARATGALVDAHFFIKASGETRLDLIGVPLRAHTVVELHGAGSRHSGKYFVGGVRHTIDADAHRMGIELFRNAWGG